MNAANYPQLSHHKLVQARAVYLGHSILFLKFCFGLLLSWVLILENVRGDGTLSPAPQRFPQLPEFMRPSGKPPGQQCIKNNVPEVDRASSGNARMV